MSRIRKQDEYDYKKLEITKVSVELLDRIGYEQFSINKVIAAADMTKGAFFHYFKSKKELIEAIVNIVLDPMSEALESIAMDRAIKPKQKILHMAKAVGKIKAEHRSTSQQLVRLLQMEKNKQIADLVVEKSIEVFLPLYEHVLIEGNLSGDFDIPHPHGSAFIYFTVLASLNKEIGRVMTNPTCDEKHLMQVKEKIKAFEIYARELFDLEEDIKVIDEAIWNIKK